MAANRAAVVVGVNTTGELTPLESAAAAELVAAWLKAEGFDVVKLTDAAKPVTAAAVKKAVTKFVKAGTYEQMVLYFSGHGYWKNNAELWLLSDAPGNADEAVSWVETIELARDSGIPHVVVISDACRSIPNTTTGMRVRGSVVFPNNPTNTRVQPKIDKLQASAIGAPAYEVALSKTSKTKTSVFTHCLREAYTNPDADMVLKVSAGKRTLEVVPNRRLEAFLRREVPAILNSVSVAYQQLAWGTNSRRRRWGRSSRTPASIPHPGGPGRPGARSWPGRPPRSSPRTSATPAPWSCAVWTCCSSSGTAPAAGTWPGSPPTRPARRWPGTPVTC
jgi:hypothetical protein